MAGHVGSQVVVRVVEVLNVPLAGVEALLFVLQLDVLAADLAAELDISVFSALDILAEIVAVSRNAVDVLPQVQDLHVLLGVHVLDSADLAVVVLQLRGFGSDVVGARLDNLLGLLDADHRLLEVELQGLVTFVLVHAFLGLHVLHVSQTLDFTEHVGSLRLDQVDVSLE
eukprot:CAMPEP_0170485420 /NCGR_PEP_ID=MMETSP0208-20121228/4702_1 /TAXON_ID=197538 /ORGANISM="Strombidium inclinatum, Strain S3" /LENGTH=169 /DNA_ID=CAMNT_0010759069 /DNA_START=275 /DNA_END=781 /DNA_ORIENTATION=-